jgi:uncharacterized protein YegJ (DUF2314 family)
VVKTTGVPQLRQVECATHGRGAEAYLCRHLIQGRGLDFHREDPTNDDPYPDAWCAACERVRARAGGWDKLEPKATPPIDLVCGHCYERIVARHMRAPTTLLDRLRRFFGRRPQKHQNVADVVHDDAVLAVSRRARDRLRADLKPRFIAGLPPGERLLVKAPFAAPNGREWMWVEVARWDGPRIHGVLDNDPIHIRDLKAGVHVDVLEEDVLDYLFCRSDGSKEGNETAALMHGKR